MIQTPPMPPTVARPRRRFSVDEFDRMIKAGILGENHRVVLIRGVIVMKDAISEPYRFTVDEYEQLVQHGILSAKDRAELIRGEIVVKVSINPPHSSSVDRTNGMLNRTFGRRVIVRIQNPVKLRDSEPEPDVSVLEFRDDYYANQHPQPDDILLLIEVSDSSLNEDRNVKGPLFAENGIREYWIINLPDDCLEVYRSPQADGTWADKQILKRGDQVEIQALPGIKINVADLL